MTPAKKTKKRKTASVVAKKTAGRKSVAKKVSASSQKRKSRTNSSKRLVAKKTKFRKTASKKSISSIPAVKKEVEKEVGFFIKNIEKFEHSVDFDIIKGLFAAATFMIIAQLIEMLTRNTTNLFYSDSTYSHMWSGFIISGTHNLLPFTIYTMIGSFFIGFLYAFFYHMVRVSLHGHAPHQPWVKGLLFGIFLIFVVAIPTAIHQFLLLNLPLGIIITWFAKDILVFLIGGTAIATIIK